MENPFSLKGKIIGQTLNNFTIIKSITIIVVYVSRLKKILSYSSLLSNTHKLFVSKVAILCTLLSIFFSTHSSLSLSYLLFSKRLPLGYFLFFLVSPCCSIIIFFFNMQRTHMLFIHKKALTALDFFS